MHHFAHARFLAPLALVAGCSPAVVVTGPPPGGGPAIFQEREPNDSPFQADPISGVDIFSYLVVQGHVQPPGFFDVYDHFEFVALEPATFDLQLDGLAPYSDMDISLWDPDLGQIVAVWDSPLNPELGTFTVTQPGKVFVLLVEAYNAPSDYDLTLMGRPILYGPGGGQGDGEERESASSAFSFPDGLPERHK